MDEIDCALRYFAYRGAGKRAAGWYGGHSMTWYDSNRQKQWELAERLREIREDLCGEHGAQLLADALKLRVETWLRYESGVTAPAHVVLKLIDFARVNPHWLLTGRGDPHDYRVSRRESRRSQF
jgi:hypothetical protein